MARHAHCDLPLGQFPKSFMTFSKLAFRYLMVAAGTSIGLVSTCAAQSNSLSLSVNSVSTSGFVSLNVSLTSAAASQPAALQWTLNYSTSDIIGFTAIEGAAAIGAGKTVTCSGNLCVIWGLNTTAIPSGVVAVLTFQLSSTVSGDLAFHITDALAASPLAEPIALDVADGRIAVVTQPILFPPDVAAGLTVMGSIAEIVSSGGWDTTINLINNGSTSTHARLKFFGYDGSDFSLPLTFPHGPDPTSTLFAASLDQTISPGATLVTRSTGPDVFPVQQGAAQVSADGSINGFAILRNRINHWETTVPIEMHNATSFLLAFDNSNGLAIGLAVANLRPQPANVQVTIRDDTGAELGAGSLFVPGSGHASFVLSTQFPFTMDKRGTIEILPPSGGQISAVGMRFTSPGTITTVPALANVGITGGSLSHIASANGWKTTFVLVNTGAAAAQAHLRFFADGGSALSLPLTFPQSGEGASSVASGLDRTMAAGATLVIESTGPDTDPLLTGSAQLTTDGDVGGFVIFRYNPNGQEATVPLENRNASAYLLAFDNTAGIVTGVAVSNASMEAAIVQVVIRDDTGAQIGTESVTLSPNGHTAFGLATQFPVTAGMRGTLEFVTPSGGRISALGIRTPPTLAFTTLPALTK